MFHPLFISHGAPDLVIANTEASRFLATLGHQLDDPAAYVVASAHFESANTLVSADAEPETIYDFGGFDPRLYQMTYKAPGAPELAAKIVEGLNGLGHPAHLARNRGFDHGTWVPLKLLRPDADIPVVQVSVHPHKDARWHFELGRKLAAVVPDDAQILGSGAFTHNLRAVFTPSGLAPRNAPLQDWVRVFDDWMTEKLEQGDLDAVLDYRKVAPYARENHPTEEHIAPLFVALGAANGKNGNVLHRSHEFGAMAMSAFAF